VLFADRFDRPRPGPAWAAGANWSIEGGALRGTLVDNSYMNGWDKFEAASLTLTGVRLPETVEVRCECWVPQPLNCEVTLLNLRTGLSIHSLLLGLPQPFGFTGSALLLMRGGGSGSGALVGVPRKHFRFLPGRHYHLRVLRERTRLTLTVDGVDGETLLSEAIPAGPAPVLLLQGAWGQSGDRVYFANLEVRAPRGRADAADDLRYARDMLWAERWSRDEASRSLVPQAGIQLGLPAPQGEAEAIKRVIFRSEEAGWLHNELPAYLAAYADDAQVVEGRSETPAEWDVTLDRRRMEAVRRLAFPVSATGELQTSYEDVQVRVDGERAECRYLSTGTGRSIFHTWRVLATLHKGPAGWKVQRVRAWPVAEKRQSVVRLDAAYWQAKDAAVAQARKDGDLRRLATALEQARRYAEARAVAQRLTGQTGATAEDWTLRSRVAFSVGEVGDARASFRTALARRPDLQPPWFLARERRVLAVSAQAVFGVDWSPDGGRLAARGIDARLHVWDARTGQEAPRLAGHLNWISGLAYHPDGRRVATGGSDYFIKLWDVVARKELRTLRGHNGRVYRLAFDRDGRRLVSASEDQTARVWDVETGSERLVLRHAAGVLGAVFSPDGHQIAAACRDGLVHIWDAATGQPVRKLPSHSRDAYRVAYSPDGRWLASAGGDGMVCLWDAASGQLLHTLKGHRAVVETVAFSPDGRRLVSGSYDADIRLWDAASGKPLEVLDGHTDGIFALAFRPDGQRLASASGDGTVRVWDVTER
jgi:WD40 repeat protein